MIRFKPIDYLVPAIALMMLALNLLEPGYLKLYLPMPRWGTATIQTPKASPQSSKTPECRSSYAKLLKTKTGGC